MAKPRARQIVAGLDVGTTKTCCIIAECPSAGPLEIIGAPTDREHDGLARSSRNVYLDLEQRKAATVLSRSLKAAKEVYENGERDAETLRGKLKEVLAGEPLATVQYVSCADYDTLEELHTVTN